MQKRKTYPPVTLALLGRQPPLGKGAIGGRPMAVPTGEWGVCAVGAGLVPSRLSDVRLCRRAAEGVGPYGGTAVCAVGAAAPGRPACPSRTPLVILSEAKDLAPGTW